MQKLNSTPLTTSIIRRVRRSSRGRGSGGRQANMALVKHNSGSSVMSHETLCSCLTPPRSLPPSKLVGSCEVRWGQTGSCDLSLGSNLCVRCLSPLSQGSTGAPCSPQPVKPTGRWGSQVEEALLGDGCWVSNSRVVRSVLGCCTKVNDGVVIEDCLVNPSITPLQPLSPTLSLLVSALSCTMHSRLTNPNPYVSPRAADHGL